MLVGAVDKRGIAYPLLKVLMLTGRTLVITDDAMYRRFDDEYRVDFGFENSHFLIQPVITQELVNRLMPIIANFDNVVYITTTEIIKADKTIYLRGINRAILGNEPLRQLEEVDHIEVFVTYSRLEDTRALKLEPSKAQLKYFSDCEDNREFLDTKDVTFVALLEALFEKELDMPRKTIKKIMLRKG